MSNNIDDNYDDDDGDYANTSECMTFQEIQNEIFRVMGIKSRTDLDDSGLEIFDNYFNQIFIASYCDNVDLSGVKPRAFTTYATYKQGMLTARIYAEKLGYTKTDAKYKIAFLQNFFGYLAEAHDDTLTPSGNIQGKNKKSKKDDESTIYVVPNPSQTTAISNDIIDLFPEFRGSAKKNAKNPNDENEKFNHIKSSMNSMMRYLGLNLYDIKNLEYPKKGTEKQLVEAEKERYRQLIVFVMIIIGVQNVMTVDKDQFNKLFERFLPVGDDGLPNFKMLHKTETRQNFVKNIYKTLRGMKNEKELMKLT